MLKSRTTTPLVFGAAAALIFSQFHKNTVNKTSALNFAFSKRMNVLVCWVAWLNQRPRTPSKSAQNTLRSSNALLTSNAVLLTAHHKIYFHKNSLLWHKTSSQPPSKTSQWTNTCWSLASTLSNTTTASSRWPDISKNLTRNSQTSVSSAPGMLAAKANS